MGNFGNEGIYKSLSLLFSSLLNPENSTDELLFVTVNVTDENFGLAT